MSRTIASRDYLDAIRKTVHFASNRQWQALLIYTSNTMLDAWAIAQVVMMQGRHTLPLVALQPLYSHPLYVANKILTLSTLFGRKIMLNVVAGGYPRDLEVLCDRVNHDQRYERLTEYVTIIQSLLRSQRPISFSGRYYNIDRAQLERCLPDPLLPEFLVSGSSPAGIEAAQRLGACAIQYLKPSASYESEALPENLQCGVRLGIVVRNSSEQAWADALKMFPVNSAGAGIRKHFENMSDSVWVRELGDVQDASSNKAYWLHPYTSNYTNCPYIVGSWDEVAAELQCYYDAGIRTFLLECPESEADYGRVSTVFKMVKRES